MLPSRRNARAGLLQDRRRRTFAGVNNLKLGPLPRPVPRPHYLPRTSKGWIATLVFLVLCLLAQPPIVHGWADRIEPWIGGVPFLYAYLFCVYVAQICVLIWALYRKI